LPSNNDLEARGETNYFCDYDRFGMVTERDIVCKWLAQDCFEAHSASACGVNDPSIHC
jgi:hypothetical protein